jgi:excisionase family DNA binding protein
MIWYTIKEAAEKLGKSQSTVRRYCDQGKISFERRRKNAWGYDTIMMISKDELDDFRGKKKAGLELWEIERLQDFKNALQNRKRWDERNLKRRK